MPFEGKILQKMGKNGPKIYDSEKKMDPKGWSAPTSGQYIHVCV